MANAIETQTRGELHRLEEIVHALQKLGALSGSIQPGDGPDYSYVVSVLSDVLVERFETVHGTVSQRLLPFVANLTSVNLG